MVQFVTVIKKFSKKGEKTGWSYIDISAAHANKIYPGNKVAFRVKGSLDSYTFNKVAVLPMGEGSFILPLNQKIRKATGKRDGDKIKVSLEHDKGKLTLSADLMACLNDDPQALDFFKSLAQSHQRYFSNWVEEAKTSITKTKRIVMAVTGLSKKQDFGAMIRSNREAKE